MDDTHQKDADNNPVFFHKRCTYAFHVTCARRVCQEGLDCPACVVVRDHPTFSASMLDQALCPLCLDPLENQQVTHSSFGLSVPGASACLRRSNYPYGNRRAAHTDMAMSNPTLSITV